MRRTNRLGRVTSIDRGPTPRIAHEISSQTIAECASRHHQKGTPAYTNSVRDNEKIRLLIPFALKHIRMPTNHPIQKHHAIEVVDLMLHRPRLESFHVVFMDITMRVIGT